MNSCERQKKYRTKKKSEGFDVVSKWVRREASSRVRRILNIVCGSLTDNPNCGLDGVVFDVSTMMNNETVAVKKDGGVWKIERMTAKEE